MRYCVVSTFFPFSPISFPHNCFLAYRQHKRCRIVMKICIMSKLTAMNTLDFYTKHNYVPNL